MSTIRHPLTFDPLPAATLETWKAIPTTIATDVLNRSQAMGAAIKPIAPGLKLVGQARTVSTMVGDNGPIHVLAALIRPGEVMVIDARAQADSAVWGEILTTTFLKQGGAGVVLDGATRDLADIRTMGFPLFCLGAVPRGPHKGWGGVIDGTIAAAGVTVNPGDLVLGDDDGVTVVPMAKVDSMLKAALAQMEQEKQWLAEIAKGRTTVDILGIAEPEMAEE